MREVADIYVHKHTCFNHTRPNPHADNFTSAQKTNQRKFSCGWWPFIVASHFLRFYFETVNLWTRLATRVHRLHYVEGGNWLTRDSLRAFSELGNGDNAACPEESADSSMWNNTIGPLLQQLESVAAGSVASAMMNLGNNVQTQHTSVVHLTQRINPLHSKYYLTFRFWSFF